MSAHIEWHNEMPTTSPKTIGRLPKKPVVWIGEIWLTIPGGEKDIRAWRSNQAITTGQAQTVLGQLLTSLINEHGKDSAVSSGFWAKSR
jgi:hypothetical protein